MSLPREDKAAKPPSVAGIEWVRKGAGWDCKLVWFEQGERKRKHLRHLGKKQWEQIREKHRGRELDDYMSQWVKSQLRQKGIEIAA